MNKSIFSKSPLFILLLLWSINIQGNERIVNIINFIRQNDYRLENSQDQLFDAVEHQISLLNQYHLPATFLLQYDALVDERYPKLLKTRLSKDSEIGAWWEITQPQVEAAHLKWRGNHPWVSTANIGFTTGYTKAERQKLVDVYMEKFKTIFNHYPRSVGSWFIDAYTLQYMKKKYHIVASCNCKDQVGTDGYTLWGGYWNQAYYPSKLNAYMPAQDKASQIDVPVFRMLGSDPIYQYDSGLGSNGQGVITMEPVYQHSGQNRAWVEGFFNTITTQPCLAFSYVQVGQENSFTWNEMSTGLQMQIPYIASLAKKNQIKVETLAQSGVWYQKNFKVTPATAVTELNDASGKENKTVWYNSRYYRCNILMNKSGNLRFRDLHLFDEKFKSPYLDTPGKDSHFSFFTLPIMDGFMWSTQKDSASIKLVRLTPDGSGEELRLKDLNVTEQDKSNLFVSAKDESGHTFTILFTQTGFQVSSDKTPYQWTLEMGAPKKDLLPFTRIDTRQVAARFQGFDYTLTSKQGYFLKATTDSSYVMRVMPEKDMISLDCTNQPVQPEVLELDGNRFLTLCLMIRTTPWEVSRDVKLHPRDEANWHTLESVKAIRETFAKGNPDGRLTWGFTMNALEDKRQNYVDIRRYAVECHNRYGDEISYFPGYFPAMYLPRERINKEMSEAIHTISEMVGNGYKPQCIMGGFLSAENLRYLSEKENIHVAHSVIWSQHAIDGGGADGSPSYPYYPSLEHFCKPAQSSKDFIDCVSLDGWTTDFICARNSGAMGHSITGYNSRRGVGPIETYKGWGIDLGNMEVMHTESLHFDTGYKLNGFGWVTNIWETQMYYEFGKDFICTALEKWITDTKKRWPDVHFVSFGEFGELWRKAHKTNDWDYHFFEHGSGLGDSYNNLELKWFMNPSFRLALLRNWHVDDSPAYVIDFTRYDLPAKEPADATPEHPHKDWSLMNVKNQKNTRPQDKPCLLKELSAGDQALIMKYYPELFK